MRTRPWMLALAALSLAALGADAYARYGVDQRDAESRILEAVLGSGANLSYPAGGLKALPPAQRAAAVQALGAAAKAFTTSDTFRARYQEAWKDRQPEAPQPPKSAEELAAAQRAEREKGLRDFEAAILRLPDDQQASMRETLEELRKQLRQVNGEELAKMDQARYADELAAFQKALAEAPPKDPKAGLRGALKRFLGMTEGIDYGAALRTDGQMRRFVDPALESKSAEWKLCFRAGREAGESARTFARAWLAELN